MSRECGFVVISRTEGFLLRAAQQPRVTGEVMKLSGGKADAKSVRERILGAVQS